MQKTHRNETQTQDARPKTPSKLSLKKLLKKIKSLKEKHLKKHLQACYQKKKNTHTHLQA